MFELPLLVTEKARDALLELSGECRYKIMTITRVGWGFFRILATEKRQGNRIVVTDKNGKALRELILPKPDLHGSTDQHKLFRPMTDAFPEELQQAIDHMIRDLDPDFRE